MKITVTAYNDTVFEADVSEEIELQNFKAICEIESAIPASNFIVLFNQSPLIDQNKSLKDYGIQNGDCVVLEKSQNYDPGTLPNLNQLAELASNPSLDIDHERLNKYLELQKNLSADPYSLEAQRLIAEEIEAQNINANLSSAYEYNPESFASVCMLYVNCKFNGHPIKAFVDSGAQTTVMSSVCAERCGLSRLIDKRYSGICHGIGVKRIVGKIHMVQLQIENDFLVNSITIIEDNIMDCLVGLDLLKRHQCCIDLKNGVLRIGTTGTETRFLPENEIPKHNEESFEKKVNLELGGAGPGPSSATASSLPSSTVTSATQLTILPGDNFTENDIKTITDSQFSRAEAIAELRKQNGNCNKALAVLFAKSLKF